MEGMCYNFTTSFGRFRVFGCSCCAPYHGISVKIMFSRCWKRFKRELRSDLPEMSLLEC